MMKKWRKLVLAVGAATLCLVAMVLAMPYAEGFLARAAGATDIPTEAFARDDGTLPNRVYFGDLCVGGMTQEEATAAVEEHVAKIADAKVTLSAGKNQIETTVGELGLSWSNPEILEEAAGLGKSGNLIERYMAMKDLEHEDKVYELAFAIDAAKVEQILESHMESLETKAVDATLTRTGGKFEITPGSQGVTVNVQDSVDTIVGYFQSGWDGADASLALVAEVAEPRGTEEDLAKVQDVLGSFHTDFSTSAAGRVANVTRGAECINGSVLYPGDTFSVYEAVNPFTPENGYELAGSYENGQTVSTYGGGICQVSTTLYNAVIRAELEIVERYAHSMIVNYVEPSMDAAIAGTYKDLKFKNNTDAPIYIEGYTDNKVIYFTVYGHETRDPDRVVSFISETTNTAEPAPKFQASNDPIGTISRIQSAHVGKSAKLWKVVTENGEEVSREEFNSSNYEPSPAIYAVGTASANPDAVLNITAAIDTQDEATIRAAASAWSDTGMGMNTFGPGMIPTIPGTVPDGSATQTVPDTSLPQDDAGTTGTGAGATGTEAGTTGTGAGATGTDTGTTGANAGVTGADAGATGADVGVDTGAEGGA